MNKYLLKVKELFVTSLTPAEPYDVALYLLNFYIAESSQRAHYRHHEQLARTLIMELDKNKLQPYPAADTTILTAQLNKLTRQQLSRMNKTGDFANLLRTFFSLYPYYVIGLRAEIVAVVKPTRHLYDLEKVSAILMTKLDSSLWGTVDRLPGFVVYGILGARLASQKKDSVVAWEVVSQLNHNIPEKFKTKIINVCVRMTLNHWWFKEKIWHDLLLYNFSEYLTADITLKIINKFANKIVQLSKEDTVDDLRISTLEHYICLFALKYNPALPSKLIKSILLSEISPAMNDSKKLADREKFSAKYLTAEMALAWLHEIRNSIPDDLIKKCLHGCRFISFISSLDKTILIKLIPDSIVYFNEASLYVRLMGSYIASFQPQLYTAEQLSIIFDILREFLNPGAAPLDMNILGERARNNMLFQGIICNMHTVLPAELKNAAVMDFLRR